MIKIKCISDLEKIHDEIIKPYISKLLQYILTEYARLCPDSATEEIGAIFIWESKSDYVLYEEMGLSLPLTESRFECIDDIGNGYCNGCIVLDNDRAINIIGKHKFFDKLREETEQ